MDNQTAIEAFRSSAEARWKEIESLREQLDTAYRERDHLTIENKRLMQIYVDVLNRVEAMERQVASNGVTRLIEAVAAQLYTHDAPRGRDRQAVACWHLVSSSLQDHYRTEAAERLSEVIPHFAFR